jgi:hypothetical protein
VSIQHDPPNRNKLSRNNLGCIMRVLAAMLMRTLAAGLISLVSCDVGLTGQEQGSRKMPLQGPLRGVLEQALRTIVQVSSA